MTGEIVEEPVEAKMRVDAGRDVALLHRPAEILDGLQQLRPLGTAQLFGRELGGVRLDPQPDRVDLGDLTSAHLYDERPAVGDLDDEPFLLQLGQRFPQRGPTDAEIRGDVRLTQLATRRHGAVEDGGTQCAVDAVRRRHPLLLPLELVVHPVVLPQCPADHLVVCRL